ncbi:hypothetical protein STANM309S_04349 [Streptomyces tanashiensis]
MWVSGRTSSIPRPSTSSMTSRLATEDSVSNTAWAHGLIFSDSLRQVPELLAPDRVERTEDHDLLVLPALQDRLQSRAEGQGGLAGAGPAAHGDDADVRVEEQIERDPLLGAAAVQPEGLPGRP